ncbi:MAG: hypothetical protein KDJ17_01035 [Hyphomicrobiaceae bacterium]|nr:hypothetical protein [Hyphomicrobiaceae bacterium]
MTVRNARFMMGLAAGLALIGSTPATAADWYSGGIKDYGGAGGVPVPAPAPIPVSSAEWYIGVAAGGVLVDDSTIDEIGTSMPVRDNLNKTMYGGISGGTYLTPNIRAEVSFDFYDDFKVAGPSEEHYMDAQAIDDTTIVGHYAVTRFDKVKVGRTTAMFNMFYDIPTGWSLRPYIGGGVGVTWRSMTRTSREHADCLYSSDASDPTFDGTACAGINSSLQSYELSETKYETDRFDIALAAMAGFSYQITPDIIWDNGYQMLWESNAIQITAPTHAGATSTVTYGDTIQHQFRTGLRFNID